MSAAAGLNVGGGGPGFERFTESAEGLLPISDRLALHTATTKPWSIEIAIEQYARAGVRGISIWRDAIDGKSVASVRRQMADAGLQGISLVRGGFFPAADPAKRRAALDDNRRYIEEAHALGLPLIVLVCGADTAQSLEDSRAQVAEALATLAPEADAAGVRLGIEPLHPMYADTRSAVVTLGQSNDLCEQVGHTAVCSVVDVYHLWWDPNLEAEIKRAGANGWLAAYHVCDWRVPTEHMLLDRGLMGEGCIPLRRIRRWVEEAGFTGPIEVEVFSTRHWSGDQTRFLKRVVHAYNEYV